MSGEANTKARLSEDRGAESAVNVVEAIDCAIEDAAQVGRFMGAALSSHPGSMSV
jgi:hypothetical protein